MKKKMSTKNNLFRKSGDGRRRFRSDERGVSAVIGVILMIAITVVVAAIIAAFAFGYTGKMTSAPSAQLLFTEKTNSGNNYIKISHEGGDGLNLSEDRTAVYLDGSEIANYPSATLGPGGLAYLTDSVGNLSTSYTAPSADLLSTGDNETVVIIIDRESSQTVAKAKLTWT
jgi:flagellin-like protein